MANYATQYYQALFTLQGSSLECETARRRVWSHVPRKVTTNMNSTLYCPLTIDEIHTALKSLSTRRAPGINGLPVEIFVAMWKILGSDLLEVYKEALASGTLCRHLNTGLLCLIPKEGCKTSLKN